MIIPNLLHIIYFKTQSKHPLNRSDSSWNMKSKHGVGCSFSVDKPKSIFFEAFHRTGGRPNKDYAGNT